MADTEQEIAPGAKTKVPERAESIATETLKRVRATEVAMVVLTGVIAFAGALTAWVYWRQLSVMEDTLGEIRAGSKDTHALAEAAGNQAAHMKRLADQTKLLAETGKTSADAAKVNADNSVKIARSAERSIAATQESARLDERAWVGVSGISNLKYTVGQPPGVTITIVNSGKTPARDVFLEHEQTWIPAGQPLPEIAQPHIRSIRSLQTLNPGQQSLALVYLILPLTQEQFDAIRLRKQIVYIRLSVAYRDQFGVGHKTNYCGTLNEEMDALTFCTAWNTSD